MISSLPLAKILLSLTNTLFFHIVAPHHLQFPLFSYWISRSRIPVAPACRDPPSNCIRAGKRVSSKMKSRNLLIMYVRRTHFIRLPIIPTELHTKLHFPGRLSIMLRLDFSFADRAMGFLAKVVEGRRSVILETRGEVI